MVQIYYVFSSTGWIKLSRGEDDGEPKMEMDMCSALEKAV